MNKMDNPLSNYKNIISKEYLDGRYVNLVGKDIPGYIFSPLMLRINSNSIALMGSMPQIPRSQDTQYLRIILEFYSGESVQQQSPIQSGIVAPAPSPVSPYQMPSVSPRRVSVVSSPIDNKPVARHSNLLIIDNAKKKIRRFEPLDGNDFDNVINTYIMRLLHDRFAGYQYRELTVHPQKTDTNIGLCVAYVIKYMYFHAVDNSVSFEGDYDIYQFGKSVIHLYGVVDNVNRDIEFGYYRYNPIAPIGLGILGGALVGGALAGGSGAILGATVGGLAGASLAAPYYF